MSPSGWLRIALRIAAMLGWLAICLAGHGLATLLDRPRRWPRRFLAGIGRIAGLRIRMLGHPHHGRTLILANHVSWLDIPALAGATGTAFIGHDGLSEVPLIRWLCALNNTVFIARHRRASVHGQVGDVRQALAGPGALTLFPEGTTSDGRALLPFKSALLSAVEPLPPGVSVQPVLLAYHHAPAIAWLGTEHGVTNFLRVLARQRPVELTLHFLPLLAGDALAGRKAMAAAAEAAIAGALRHTHHRAGLPTGGQLP